MMMGFIIFMLILTNGVHTVMGDAFWEPKFKEVSGSDESEENKGMMLEKFRVLLGLRTLHKIKPLTDAYGDGSPAPSPSAAAFAVEVPSPAPGPAPHTHPHPHHRFHHLRLNHPPYIHDQKIEKGKGKIFKIAVLVSVGVMLVISALGLIWAGRKFYRHRKRATRTVSVYSSEGGARDRSKNGTPQKKIAEKVSNEPGFDLFYLDSLTTALEPQTCFKEPPDDYVCALSVQNALSSAPQKREDSDHVAAKLGYESASSSAEEITRVHEYAESIKYDSNGQNSSTGDKIIRIEHDSSDDESFHSLCNSNSFGNGRFSNASSGSLNDAIECLPPELSDKSASSPSSTPNLTMSPKYPPPPSNIDTQLSNHLKYITHQPPPPPPLPPFARFSPSRPFVARSTSRAFHSSTLLSISSPRNSDSSSGSNQTPQCDLSSTPKTAERPQVASNVPPPPLLKGNNSTNGPPPPPAQLPQFMMLGKDGSSLPKLKPLHWDKVRAAPDRSMVWDKLRCSSFELDEEMIESLFGYNLKTAFKNDEGKSKSPSPSKHVLEPKRLQNITILSKSLNVTAEQVCETLIRGDGLCLQQLEALVKMAPTKEEEAKLSNYKGGINELGSAEKLVKAMLTVPLAFPRIEAMLYRASFEDEVVHLRNSFSMLEEACKELRSSRLFLKLLEAVLKTGNRMNVGTIRGGATAFKLDTLLKLADVKGTDGKTTLLHFVVQEIIRSEGIRVSESIMGKIDQNNKGRTMEEKEDDYRRMGLELVCGLSAELCNVKRTASIDLDVLATSVSNISDGMSKLQELVHKDLHKYASTDNFVQTMKAFLHHAEKNLKELQEDENKVFLSVREITEYYHGDVSKDETNPLRIFVIVRDFLGMLDQVCRELKSLKTPRSPNPLAPFR